MDPTELRFDEHFSIDEVSPLVFGGFLEHMGRAVYEGVYQPESSLADEDGFRTDVIAALRDLEMTIVRYPGGNFVSGYHWQDGIGPKDQRPRVRELAWQSLEPNQFGTDEFMKLCRKLDWEPMLAVNLGTGTPEEARNWVEYCNSPVGSRYADLRAEHGSEQPYDVKYWCLGNEMDGPWQLGHVPAQQYAIRAQQAAKMIKDCDRRARLVACGSSSPRMPTYLDWDRQVLEHLGGLAHFMSLHRYVGNQKQSTSDYLAIGNDIDAQIEAVDACARFVGAKRGRDKRALLCFDEWNVWYKTLAPEHMDGRGKVAPPLIEEIYNLEDALVVASFLMSFVRHADVVKIANMAQIVNVIAPVLTRGDELLKQSIYYAFQMVSRRKHGVALRAAVRGPSYNSALYGETHYLDAAGIVDQERSQLSVFALNRSTEESMPLSVHLAGRELAQVVNAEILCAPGATDENSWEEPERVISRPFDGFKFGEAATTELPPLSFLAVTFETG